jgi:hypothetical protein
MDAEICKRKERKTFGKRVYINLRIDERISQWINRENLSPTLIFVNACKELGFKEEQ